MKLIKRVLSMTIVSMMLMMIQPIYATETTFRQPEVQLEEVAEVEPTTTNTSIVFEENEYVRITQPTPGNETRTFDSQINILGVAREGTNIVIRVYQDLDGNGVIAPDELQNEYKLGEIGATQTFSQVITLNEGVNYVYVNFSPKDQQSYQSIRFEIIRESEEKKDLLTNFLVDGDWISTGLGNEIN